MFLRTYQTKTYNPKKIDNNFLYYYNDYNNLLANQTKNNNDGESEKNEDTRKSISYKLDNDINNLNELYHDKNPLPFDLLKNQPADVKKSYNNAIKISELQNAIYYMSDIVNNVLNFANYMA